MDRLSIVLTFATGSVLVGGLVIAVLTAGYYGWVPILIAVAVGMLASWPVAYVISRRIKHRDPDWPDRDPKPSATPDPNAPEV